MCSQDRTGKKNWTLPLAGVLLLGLPGLALAQTADSQPEAPLAEQVDAALSHIVDSLASVLFYDFGTGAPLVVLWLITGAIFFTFRMGFINVRAFRHAIEVVRGKYDDPKDKGEVTHFQALTSALSGTVGLGNIAGVTIAVSTGGPGAVFWMLVAGHNACIDGVSLMPLLRPNVSPIVIVSRQSFGQGDLRPPTRRGRAYDL